MTVAASGGIEPPLGGVATGCCDRAAGLRRGGAEAADAPRGVFGKAASHLHRSEILPAERPRAEPGYSPRGKRLLSSSTLRSM